MLGVGETKPGLLGEEEAGRLDEQYLLLSGGRGECGHVLPAGRSDGAGVSLLHPVERGRETKRERDPPHHSCTAGRQSVQREGESIPLCL